MTLDTQIKTSRDLAEIIALAGDLHTQAVNDATAIVDGHSLPGGRAMVALAPVASLARWEQRVEEAEAAWVDYETARRQLERSVVLADPDRPDFTADEDDTSEPALQVLRFWTDHYRRVLNQAWDHKPTLVTEAKFLRHNLDWVAAHEPNWAHFTRDVNRARRHLETILYAGYRPDRTRVTCDRPTCEPKGPERKRPQLIRVYAARTVAEWRCRECNTQVPADAVLAHCPNPRCWSVLPPTPVWTSDESKDRWKCPACKARFDDDAYRRAHATQLRHESAAKYVLLADAIGTLVAQGRNERVVRRWLEPSLRHHDQCARCRSLWPEQEHAACPRKLKDPKTKELTGEECGGDLKRVARGDAEAVVESWCDTRTRKVWVWWPDLWRLHLATPSRARRTA